MDKLIYIFIGGGFGSICRYLIGRGLINYSNFPYGTLVANALSCILLGMMVAWVTVKSPDQRWSLLILTGFCGGFSTYSTFTYETLQLLKKEDYLLAGANIFGNLLLCIVSILIGIKLINLIFGR